MAHTGEVGTRGFRSTLSVMRVFVVVFTVLICAGTVLMLKLPAAIAGLLAGIAVAALLVCEKPLFEVASIKCPSCSTEILTIKDFGSYRCSNCQQELRIEGTKAYSVNSLN